MKSSEKWLEVRIGDIGQIHTGRTPSTKCPDYFGNDVFFITPRDMHQGKHIHSTERSLSIKGAKLLQRIQLPPKSVCVSCIGWQMGEVVMTSKKSITNQQINSIVPNKNIDADFLYYSFVPRKQPLLSLASAIGVRTPILNKSGFCDLIINLPPLPTQRKIAAILSAYDDLIENNLRRIKILEEMAQNLYREWFVKFRFPGHENAKFVDSPLGMIPEGWEVVRLDDVVDFAKGRKPQETRTEPNENDVRYLLIDVLRGGIPQYTTPNKLILAEKRDSIMVMDGGSSCEVIQGYSGAVGSTLGRFRTTNPEKFSSHALYRYFIEMFENFKSKNVGSAIPHANKDYILSQNIILPIKTISSLFHENLEPIQSAIEILNNKNSTLRQTRNLLLPKLISGELDVSELDIDIPEENKQ